MPLKFKYLLINALIALSIVSATGIQISLDYRETKKQQEVMVSDITKVVKSHVHTTVQQTENILNLISKNIMLENSLDNFQTFDNVDLLNTYCYTLIGCRYITIANANGDTVASSGSASTSQLNISQKQFFKESLKTRMLVITPASVSDLPDNPILFNIAKSLVNENGSVVAVISAGLDAHHITDFYGLMGFGFSPTVGLLRMNGDIVTRSPNLQDYLGKNVGNGRLFQELLQKSHNGVYKSVSVLDYKTRIASYVTIPQWDVVIFAGIENQVAFHAWKERSERLSIIMATVLFLSSLILFYGYRSTVQHDSLKATNHDLDKLAHFDGLTSIANRRSFNIKLKQAWVQHKENGMDISLLFIDVDFFKAYNDNYGHQQGDKCLYKVAQTLDKITHDDIIAVARYGGEEFAVILSTVPPKAYIQAERFREGVNALHIKHEYSKASPFISISVGLSSTLEAKSIEELIKKADDALYKAKAQGRNRVFPSYIS